MTSCSETASAEGKIDSGTATEICSCMIGEIQNAYTFDEFKQIDEDEKKAAEIVEPVAKSCTQKVVGANS